MDDGQLRLDPDLALNATTFWTVTSWLIRPLDNLSLFFIEESSIIGVYSSCEL
jgi:hypothetical protein